MQIHPTGLIFSFLLSFLPAVRCGLWRQQLEIITAFIHLFFLFRLEQVSGSYIFHYKLGVDR